MGQAPNLRGRGTYCARYPIIAAIKEIQYVRARVHFMCGLAGRRLNLLIIIVHLAVPVAATMVASSSMIQAPSMPFTILLSVELSGSSIRLFLVLQMYMVCAIYDTTVYTDTLKRGLTT